MFQDNEASPGKTGQYSAAAGITARSGLQLLPPKLPSHRRITLAQRTGSATGKECNQGSTSGRTTAPKPLSPKPPTTDSNQPSRHSSTSQPSRHVSPASISSKGLGRHRSVQSSASAKARLEAQRQQDDDDRIVAFLQLMDERDERRHKETMRRLHAEAEENEQRWKAEREERKRRNGCCRANQWKETA